MRVTGGSHGQASNLGVLESVRVITAKRCRGIKDFYGVDRQSFQSRKPNSSTEQIVRMRRNGEPASLVDYVAYLSSWFSLQVRQLCANAQKMTIGSRHFYSRQNEKTIDWHSVQSHQTFLKQVIDGIAGVVIGDGNSM